MSGELLSYKKTTFFDNHQLNDKQFKGDSGGFLTCDGSKLTGIVSFGYNCGLPNYPGS